MPSDSEFLRTQTRPDYETRPEAVSIVDLFSGCGGLTLGVAESARRVGLSADVRLAVDFDEAISRVYATNFPKARVETAPVETLFDGVLCEDPSNREAWLATELGSVDFLVGGPPCQGHSDLNNHSRRRDPRNSLYMHMARAAEVLMPRIVIIENVRPVVHDDQHVVEETIAHLRSLGYDVGAEVVDFTRLGIPQRRKRHTVLALRDVDVPAQGVLESIGGSGENRTLDWAIGDLVGVDDHPLDIPSVMAGQNRARVDWLFERDEYDLIDELRPPCHRDKPHTYRSVYGRLRWDEPAQTMTSGYGSMGQGRYVHPSEPRTLTPHEAARIQFFPDWFDFTAGGIELRRTKWATMIGNAVPPKLTMALGEALIPHLRT